MSLCANVTHGLLHWWTKTDCLGTFEFGVNDLFVFNSFFGYTTFEHEHAVIFISFLQSYAGAVRAVAIKF